MTLEPLWPKASYVCIVCTGGIGGRALHTGAPSPASEYFFFFIALGLELSVTKVYEP